MGGVVLDIDPRLLLIHAGAVSLALLAAAVVLPLLARLILPARVFAALEQLVSPPPDSSADHSEQEATTGETRQDRKVVALVGLGTAEATAWAAGFVWAAVRAARGGAGREEWMAVGAMGALAVAWTLSSLLLLPRIRTPALLQAPAPMLHFTFYLFQLAVLALYGISLALHPARRTPPSVLFTLLHSAALLSLIGVTLSMPIEPTPVSHSSPTPTASPADVATEEVEDDRDRIFLDSPEDKVSLGSWIVFGFVGDLIEKGRRTKLGYRDVWKLPSLMQSEVVQEGAAKLSSTRIIPRVFWGNSLDIILSLSLHSVGLVLNYGGVYAIKQILESLSSPVPNPTLRQSAYIYAALAFLAQITKAEVDLQQLWHERRAITRTKTQLMGEVYAKALKRKDVSGAVAPKEAGKGADGKKDGAGKAAAKGKEGKKKELPEARGTSSTGKIVSLFGGDVNKVAMQVMQLSSLFNAPVELVIAISFLYQLLGWTAIAGLVVMALALPINHLLVKRRIKMHRSMLSARDARNEILNELINAVRFVKYSAEEEEFIARVTDAREKELAQVLRTRMNGLYVNALWNISPDLVMLVSFGCFTILAHKQLTVPIAFTALALFNMVRAPMTMLPTSIVNVLQTWVSIQRLEKFFGEEEVEPWVSALRIEGTSSSASSGSGVGIEGGTFVYGEKADLPAIEAAAAAAAERAGEEGAEPQFRLEDITVDFPEGKLSLVCGATGSGKSSLFLALLGEMTRLSGSIHLSKATVGSPLDPETGLYDGVAYAAQLPWLQHASIRNNILFGSPFEAERYEAVLEACALRPDLALFDAGDATEIGEKGISLSGGQKARVALARAVYSRAKTVLLDDPLSAVDSHTARHLFRKCLRGPLLENRTVILVTHHVSLCLGASEYVVRMSEGRVALQGRVNDLDKAELTTELVEGDDEADEAEQADKKPEKEQDPKEAEHAAAAALGPPSSSSSTAASTGPTPTPSGAATPKRGSGKLVEAEARATGRVKTRIYLTYLKSAGLFTWAAMIVLTLAGRVGRVGDRAFFKAWGESYRPSSNNLLFRLFMPTNNQLALVGFDAQAVDLVDMAAFPISRHNGTLHLNFPSASDNVEFYLVGYLIICLLNLLVTILSVLSAFQGSFRASRELFNQMLRRIVYAPFRYFDKTPTGRILNRFAQDMTTIDGSLVDSFRITFTHLSSFVVNVGVMVVSPQFIPPAAVIVFLYYRYASMFIKTSRDLRRLESNARSPIFSKFGETLNGIVTTRAFGAERRFLKGLWEAVDTMQAVSYSSAVANRFLLYRFDFLGAIAVGLTTVFALFSGSSPGLAALAITSAQGLCQSVYWSSRFVSQLEVDLNAVERVVEVLDLEQEPAQIVASNRPPANWPSSVGGLSLEDLVVSYAPNLPPVIKGVSVDIPPRSKVGLVGRTGSGKSTLAMSLLRFTEPTSGRIVIDGVDVTKIGLHDLRRALTLIPQEAVLFSGTVRSNLDPFNNSTDAECLQVLDRVGLINPASSSSATPALGLTPVPSAGPSRSASPAPAQGKTVPTEVPTTADPAVAEAGDGRAPARVPETGHGGQVVAGTVEHAAGKTVSEGEGEGEGSETTAVATVAPGSSGRLSVTLSTPVSAGGNNFSAGQRQLLALARALLRKSRVIIMDEATASVDFETDAKIQHCIRDEFSESLVLTIAHRLRTVVDYDLILVLDAGKVVEFDAPSALLRNKEGVFRRMAEKAADWEQLREVAGLGREE
ncbi:hypothetical protein JCM8097_000654 [Rhodosporidiobolus ruineniae]